MFVLVSEHKEHENQTKWAEVTLEAQLLPSLKAGFITQLLFELNSTKLDSGQCSQLAQGTTLESLCSFTNRSYFVWFYAVQPFNHIEN